MIFFFDLMLLELFFQELERCIILRDDERAGSILVETVHDAGAIDLFVADNKRLAHAGNFRIFFHDKIRQAFFRILAVAMHGNA